MVKVDATLDPDLDLDLARTAVEAEECGHEVEIIDRDRIDIVVEYGEGLANSISIDDLRAGLGIPRHPIPPVGDMPRDEEPARKLTREERIATAKETIAAAALDVRERQIGLKAAKDFLKDAVDEYDALLNGSDEDEEEEDDDGEEMFEVGDEPHRDLPKLTSPDAWKLLPIQTLAQFGVPEKVCDKLEEGGAATLGAYNGNHKYPYIGPEKKGKISDAFQKFYASIDPAVDEGLQPRTLPIPEKASPAPEEAESDTEAGEEQVAAEQADPPVDPKRKKKPREKPQDRPEPPEGFTQTLLTRLEAIKEADPSLDAQTSDVVWQAGNDAAKENEPIRACPHIEAGDSQDDWIRGWMSYKLQRSREIEAEETAGVRS